MPLGVCYDILRSTQPCVVGGPDLHCFQAMAELYPYLSSYLLLLLHMLISYSSSSFTTECPFFFFFFFFWREEPAFCTNNNNLQMVTVLTGRCGLQCGDQSMICNASKFEVGRCQSAVDYDLRALLCKSSSKEAFFSPKLAAPPVVRCCSLRPSAEDAGFVTWWEAATVFHEPCCWSRSQEVFISNSVIKEKNRQGQQQKQVVGKSQTVQVE